MSPSLPLAQKEFLSGHLRSPEMTSMLSLFGIRAVLGYSGFEMSELSVTGYIASHRDWVLRSGSGVYMDESAWKPLGKYAVLFRVQARRDIPWDIDSAHFRCCCFFILAAVMGSASCSVHSAMTEMADLRHSSKPERPFWSMLSRTGHFPDGPVAPAFIG